MNMKTLTETSTFRVLSLLLCFCFFILAMNVSASSLQADKFKVSGIVKDATGEPVIGASVVEKGTTNGTVTDLDGNFNLSVASNSTIVISFIGYSDQEFHISKDNMVLNGSPDKSGGKFFNSIENLHLCTMNNQGLLALAQLILPSEILSNFEVVRVEEEASLIRIYLDESVKAEYKENPEIESKGFCEAVTIRDFPIRDKGVDLIVRRRKWYDKQNNRYFSDSYDLKAEETRYSKEFAAFLKGVYGDDSYDLPFA